MWDEFAQFEAEHGRLSQHKRNCTGEPLPSLLRQELPAEVDNRSTFKDLVSHVYVLWQEEWGRDVGFLVGVPGQDTKRAQRFGRELKRARTVLVHSPSELDSSAQADWYHQACGTRLPSTPENWATSAKQLIVELTEAIAELADAAMAVQQVEDKRQAWQERLAESVRSAVVRVAADLGIWLSESQINYHKRQLDGRWRNHRVPQGKTPRSELDALVECSLMARSPRLPCGHLDVLRELNVIGSPEAFAGIQLAHAVAMISQASGDPFLKLVVATWDAVHRHRKHPGPAPAA
ncbi:hypothetical protein [Kutzneria chonburiensis]|uniref:Uncharacterized protein n=1 Tax=Kutzneria chonburiensis TaxID=1483604 RepID=A0ABV6MNN1_9PSEU|nr:hypothetical protein [Kutzneria chonburiensis]